MTSRRHLSLVAGAATLLAAAPLSAIFDQWTWFFQSFVAVGLIVGSAILTRSLRAPAWAQVLAMAASLVVALTLIFPSHREILGIIPSQATFANFGALMSQSVEDVRSYGVPVPDRDGLLFVTVLGIGAVAIVVDIVTVAMRRPALAGLPMLAVYSVPVAVLQDAVSPIPFIIGASGFLWLLVADRVDRVRRFGRRFTGDGRDVDVWEPSPLAAAGRRLAVVGVAIAIVVPVLVPGMTGGLIERLGGAGAGPGPGDGSRRGAGSVDLFAELSGRLTQDETQDLVKVETDDPSPFYLRIGVADDVTPRGFRNRAPRGQSVNRDLKDPRENAVDGVSYEEHRARIRVSRDFDMPYLPVYAQPVNIDDLDSSWFYDENGVSIFSGRSRSRGKDYEFQFVRPSYSVEALRSAKPLPVGDPLQRYVSLPVEVREVRELLKELTGGLTNQYDRVRAIYDFFSPQNGFTYSLETKPGTNAQAIVNFLDVDNRTGFCEQYAAAMAWLVRAEGFPARVAFGFTRGTPTETNRYTLTNKNLHAWTEVYFAGFGWVPFDATPSAGVIGSTRSAWAPDTATPTPTASGTAAPGATGPASTADPGFRDPKDEDPFPETPRPGIAPSASNWPWWTLGASLVALMLLAVPALMRLLVRRRRHAVAVAGPGARVSTAAADGPPPGEARVVVTDEAEATRARLDAHAAWDELLDTLVDFQVRVDPTETPRSTAERLVAEESLPEGAAEGVRLLGYAEERARYARTPLFGSRLVDALRTVRRTMAQQASRRIRLRALLMPPSVLLRWRTTIMDRSGDFAAAATRWREGLTRLSPRRLLMIRSR